ncbi:MAG TPA: transketolase C-terminal domain-containing protein [Bryobacteraceae bacterium]|nr:transketolase C-terminal domain-containing protein [Bryobacteraceae bacterium]
MTPKTKFELKAGPATREAFGRALVELGRENKDIVVCDADLSKSTMTVYFQKEFPERFFSFGIAEANMVAAGAGMALAGKIPFVSSFSAFVMNKGFEQLRACVAYPHVNVKVVGTHSGISIGEDGPSQMSIEEISLACSLAGFVVLAPADEASTKALVRQAAAYVGPVFIRCGRVKAPLIYSGNESFQIGKAVQVVEGSDVTIVADGLLVAQAILAAEMLEGEGISARVLDMHTVKPLDRAAIQKAAQETGAMVVAEEHLVDCGLGVRVAQVVAETHPCPMEFVGIHNTYAESGQPDELLEKYGLVARDVKAAVHNVLARKR